jgi:hypothetical protein
MPLCGLQVKRVLWHGSARYQKDDEKSINKSWITRNKEKTLRKVGDPRKMLITFPVNLLCFGFTFATI